MSHSSPTAILLNIGHAMDHWIIVVFAYTWGVIAGVWGVEWTELTPFNYGALFMFGMGSIVSGRLGDHWGRWIMMVIFFAGMGVSVADHRVVQQQVADRRGADPDGRLRLDLPSGRHPDAGAEGQELRLHHRRERAGRQHGHRHRRRRLGLHRPALRLADGLHHPGRDLPDLRRGLRGPGAARGGGAGQAQAEDDRPAAGRDGARVRHHDLHRGDRQHHLQLHDQR